MESRKEGVWGENQSWSRQEMFGFKYAKRNQLLFQVELPHLWNQSWLFPSPWEALSSCSPPFDTRGLWNLQDKRRRKRELRLDPSGTEGWRMGERVGRVWEKEGVYRQELPEEREQRFRKKFGKFSNTTQNMRDVISKLAKEKGGIVFRIQ